MNKQKSTRVKYSSTEIIQLFAELESCERGTEKSNQILKLLITKLYYIPTRMVQKYWWSDNLTDMHQAGLEGLMKAVYRFDYKQSNDFYLYSWRAVKGEIIKEQKAIIEWLDVCKASLPVEEFENALVDGSNPEEELIRQQNIEILNKFVNNLDCRSRDVLRMYLGLDEDNRSLRYLSEKFQISHETVRKIRDDTITRLTEMFASYSGQVPNEQ